MFRASGTNEGVLELYLKFAVPYEGFLEPILGNVVPCEGIL